MIMYEAIQNKVPVSRTISLSKRIGTPRHLFNDNRKSLFQKDPVQRYRSNSPYKISENKEYMTNEGCTLYFQNTFPEPAEFFIQVADEKINGTIWHACCYNADSFTNDCGDFASALMSGNLGYMGEESESLPDFHPIDLHRCLCKNIDVREGEVYNFLDLLTHKKSNQQYAWNESAAPNIREAYFAARTTKRYNGCPYHVAAVVATDENDRITCEADASDEALIDPIFDMYSVNGKGSTFHDEQTSGYGNKRNPGITLLVGMDS